MIHKTRLPLSARDKPSAWTPLFRWWGRRNGIDLSGVTFGAGRPWPHVKNESGRMDLGRIFLARGIRLWAHKGGELIIADETVLDENVEIVAWERVVIGRSCYLGWDVLIMDTDLHPVKGRPLHNRPVVIGDNVYIGCRAMILKGVTIGQDAVIHPGAIVTRDIPPKGKALAAEARVIKRG